jgi:Protein of unknown function (DUF3365)
MSINHAMPIAILLMALAGAGTAAAQTLVPRQPAVDPEVIARSDALADRFQQRLQTSLRAAIAEQGLPGAVSVCSTLAPAIAAEESAVSGARVSRIAARNRNPAAHLPRDVRKHYVALAAQPVEAGKPAVRVWRSGRGRLARITYLRAIPMMGQPCLSCHGTDIDPAVGARIAKIYPEDKATGFKPGELRGALLVRWNVADLADWK